MATGVTASTIAVHETQPETETPDPIRHKVYIFALSIITAVGIYFFMPTLIGYSLASLSILAGSIPMLFELFAEHTQPEPIQETPAPVAPPRVVTQPPPPLLGRAQNQFKFWKALPGGTEYVAAHRMEITNVNIGLLLRAWIAENCSELTELDLSNRQLTALPYDTAELPNLRTLNLSNNPFTHGEQDMSFFGIFLRMHHLENLEELNLSHCGLTTFGPGFFDRLEGLRSLDLSHNAIETLPDTFISTGEHLRSLAQLTSLDISHNNLTAMPPRLLSSILEHLNLSHNRLSQINVGDRYGPTSNQTIQTLDLSHNEITLLQVDLTSFTGIRQIDISHNQILRVNSDIFRQLQQLQELDLSHNRISHVGTSGIGGIVLPDSLQILRVNNNHMLFNVFNRLRVANLQLFDLRNNPCFPE